METTSGTLLGGRVRYGQPRNGYRTGIEPVLLAASVPARAGDLVIEGGTGAGAGLMCLSARVPGIVGLGIEIDPAMADLARANVADNGMVGLTIWTRDVTVVDLPSAKHVIANPPWHDPQSSASPVERRRLAKQEGAGIEAWVTTLARGVGEGGSMTIIIPPRLTERMNAACALAGLGGGFTVSLLPKTGRAPKLMLVQRWREETSPVREREVVLHDEGGRFTPPIEAVLRAGEAFELE